MSQEQPAPTPGPAKPGNDNTFFDWMRGLGIPRQPGWIGGVCAGIAARLGIDPLIVRGIAVVIAVLGGPALLLYAAAWLLLPDQYDRIHLQEAIRGNFDRAHAGIGVMVLLSFLPFAQGLSWQAAPWWIFGENFWFGPTLWALFWTLAVLGSIVWLVIWLVNRSKGTGPGGIAPATPPTSAFGTTAWTADAASTTVVMPTPPASPPAPPHPESGATDDDLAAWKEQQAAWKREYDNWKQQQAAGERELALQRAAEQRRIKQEQSAQRHRAAIEEQQRTRSNSVYSLVAIGLAIIAGAATALVIGETGDATAAMTGMAVSLAILGLAIIINGFRGKRSGGSGGVAFLLVIALSATSFFSWASEPLTGRDLRWSPSYSTSTEEIRRTVLNRDVVLDLTEYFERQPTSSADARGVIDLFVARGDVRVILPADEFSSVSAQAWTGTIRTPGDSTRFGPFARSKGTFTPVSGNRGDDRSFLVSIRVARGDITIIQSSR